jgi:hypothetical protein
VKSSPGTRRKRRKPLSIKVDGSAAVAIPSAGKARPDQRQLAGPLGQVQRPQPTEVRRRRKAIAAIARIYLGVPALAASAAAVLALLAVRP